MVVDSNKKQISIAIIGNPNSGKTSLYNHITGEHEHVGNYSGITVKAKSASFSHKGYDITITDLPGTNALSANTPEESYVRNYLIEHAPDIVLNVICASNIERNLYLTTELIDMSQRIVVALSMYDELEHNGTILDHDLLGKMMGVPMLPVDGRSGRGIEELLDTVVAIHENRDTRVRHIHIYQGVVEASLIALNKEIRQHREELPQCFPPRYFAMKMLEGDQDIVKMVAACPHFSEWQRICEKEQGHLRSDLGATEDIRTTMANQKHGFIAGALRETLTKGKARLENISHTIDQIVTHPILGYPIFILVIWLMFYCTFSLGAYPHAWIEQLVGLASDAFNGWLPDGTLKDLICDGIIGGVGSVIVFLPNIMILYLFISFMEDSGYLARASFIMDRFMHKIGLHGKSFIPLIMGFGCNVPAIISTRIIESRSSRLITTFIIPFMSCSGRLPIYVILIGTFFAAHSSLIMLGLYLLGIVVAMITAVLLRKFFFKEDETPFVMELPPYRIPTAKATLSHMWLRCYQYIKKMWGMVLIASIIVWALGYFPRQEEKVSEATHMEQSYIGHIGHFCEPAFAPLGLDWKASVSLLSGIAGKELMVSTLGVLYSDNSTDDNSVQLTENLKKSGDFTTPSALALLVFSLLYLPCVATIAAIWSESGWKWAIASTIYTIAIAWLCAFGVYNIALLFI
ncbi:MAG: ferrous iron transport protein B [Alistipes sp.]|nr:ferrous iron transport protein B [Alistipes sp.]